MSTGVSPIEKDGVPARLGMIGLGNMGGRIAARLAGAGWQISGYDIDGDAASQWGVPRAELDELVDTVDVIFLSLPDSRVVEDVLVGRSRVVERLRAGQVVVDLSTSSPDTTRRLAEVVGATGAAFVDAGISGGAKAAERGALVIMAGGAREALDRVTPALEDIAIALHHLGPSGAGHTAKVVNNFLNAINLAASAEAMVAARKAGLDPGRFLDVVNSSSGMNWATVNRFPSIVQGDYLEGGLSGRLMVKDILLYLDLVARLDVPSMLGPACLSVFAVSNELGYADEISNRVVDGLGDLAGGIRLHERSDDQRSPA